VDAHKRSTRARAWCGCGGLSTPSVTWFRRGNGAESSSRVTRRRAVGDSRGPTRGRSRTSSRARAGWPPRRAFNSIRDLVPARSRPTWRAALCVWTSPFLLDREWDSTGHVIDDELERHRAARSSRRGALEDDPGTRLPGQDVRERRWREGDLARVDHRAGADTHREPDMSALGARPLARPCRIAQTTHESRAHGSRSARPRARRSHLHRS